MKFDELDDKAKERARERWREDTVQYGWWEDTYSDVVRTGALMGLTVGENTTRTIGGKMIPEYDISFSGFWNQGDGACWSGYIDTNLLAGATERVKAERPNDEGLHALTAQSEELHGAIVAEQVKNRLVDDDMNRDWPDCHIGMTINVNGKDHWYRTRASSDDIPENVEEIANRLVDAFASWIYRQLEAEHDYRTSDETVEENIRANDYEFDEEGNCQ